MLLILDISAWDGLWMKNDFCGDLGTDEIWLLSNWWNDFVFSNLWDCYKFSEGAILLDGDPLLNTTPFCDCGTVLAIKLETIFLCLFGLTLGPNVCTGDLLPIFNTLDYLSAIEGLLEAIILDLDLLLSLIGDDFM